MKRSPFHNVQELSSLEVIYNSNSESVTVEHLVDQILKASFLLLRVVGRR